MGHLFGIQMDDDATPLPIFVNDKKTQVESKDFKRENEFKNENETSCLKEKAASIDALTDAPSITSPLAEEKKIIQVKMKPRSKISAMKRIPSSNKEKTKVTRNKNSKWLPIQKSSDNLLSTKNSVDELSPVPSKQNATPKTGTIKSENTINKSLEAKNNCASVNDDYSLRISKVIRNISLYR